MLGDTSRSFADNARTIGVETGDGGDALTTVFFRRLDDRGHRTDSLDRESADRGLTGQHDRIGTIENGVRTVGRLGARGARVLDHGIHDLRRDDNRLGSNTGKLNRALLDQRHGFQGHLNAEVTAGDHDAVEGLDDLFQRLNSLRLLDLGNDRDALAHLVHDLVDILDVLGRTHEGQGDEVGILLDTPAQILLVLLGQGGDGDGDAR